MNKAIIMGRLTRDPELRYANGRDGQMAVTNYSVAVDRRIKREGEADADFFNCTVFGKSAEFAEKYFKKGMKVLITGRLQNDNYTNRNGEKVYSTNIIVEEQEFAESKAAGQGNSTEATPAKGQDIGDGFVTVSENLDEELPFN